MKRYALFTCSAVAPRGGWHDMCGLYDRFEDAKWQVTRMIEAYIAYDVRRDFESHIVDMRTQKIIYHATTSQVFDYRKKQRKRPKIG